MQCRKYEEVSEKPIEQRIYHANIGFHEAYRKTSVEGREESQQIISLSDGMIDGIMLHLIFRFWNLSDAPPMDGTNHEVCSTVINIYPMQ